MKNKHDSMLPANAFQMRGSVVGGRGMQLHGDSDDYWNQDYSSYDPSQGQWVTYNADAGAVWVPNPVEAAPAPVTPQPVAPTPPPPAPLAPPPAPSAAPAPPPPAPAYAPFNIDEFGGYKLGEQRSDQHMAYARAAELANWQMGRGRPDLAQQFIDEANSLRSVLSQPYFVGTSTSGSGGDAGYSTDTILYTPSGEYSVSQDDAGNYVANIPSSGGGESDGIPSYTGAAIDVNALAEQEKKALEKQFGTGFGPSLGYAYEMKNSEGDPYRRFDAQGNLTEYLDQHGQWQKASAVTPVGTRLNPETGQLDTVYSYGGREDITGDWVPGMSKYHEDQGGFLGEGGWSRLGGLVAAGLTAGIAGGALSGIGLGVAPGGAALVPGSAAAIGTAAAQGALTGIAVSGLQGADPADMLKAGVLGAISAGATNGIAGADLGTLGTTVARTGTQAGLTAIAGGDVEDAIVSGIIGSVLPTVISEALPTGVADVLSGLPEPLQKVVMSTATNVLNAGFNGQDISDAAVKGVTNGLISLGKDLASGVFDDLTDSEFSYTVEDYLSPETTAGGFLGDYEDAVATLPETTGFTQPVPPPLVQEAINRNVDPYEVYRELVAGYEAPYVGTAYAPLASAVTSDVNPVAIDEGMAVDISGANPRTEELLNIYNTGMREAGFPEATYDDESFINWMSSISPAQSGVSISDIANLSPSEAQSVGIPAGLYTIIKGDASAPASSAYSPDGTPLPLGDLRSVYNDILNLAKDADTIALIENNGKLVSDALYDHSMRGGATPEQAQMIADAFINNAGDVTAFRRDVEQYINAPEMAEPVPPPLVQDAINRNIEQQEQIEPQKPEPVVSEPEETKTERVDKEKSTENDTKAGGSGTQGGSFAGDEGRVGAASPLAAAADSASDDATVTDANIDAAAALASLTENQEYIENESESVVSELASMGAIDPADIPIVIANLTESSKILNVTPTVAIATELVKVDGTLSDKGVEKVASETGLSTQEVANAVQGSSTVETSTGSGLKSDGAGAATGEGTGVSGDQGLGGKSGEGIGGKGEGVGTGEGDGEGTGKGGGLPSYGGSFGGARLILNPQFPGALPGALEGTYLKGVEVDEYDPFADYNVYQQLEPIRAAQGGSPLQLMQMQQGIVGYDPSGFSSVQYRPQPNYFTYGSSPENVQPTTFAGSQLMGKPRPNIPVTPTGNIGSSDWLYGTAGSNQLSPAGASIPALSSGMMANGGKAHGGGTDEHIPEFITGATGHYVRGRGDGQSDDIPAMLADGEYVFDSSSVSTLGNGSSDAGAKLLDAFRETLREHTRSAPKDKIPPKASPLMYMQEAMKKVGMK